MYLPKDFEFIINNEIYKVFQEGDYLNTDLILIYKNSELEPSGQLSLNSILGINETNEKRILTKLQFRNLFTLEEKLAIDNYQTSALPDNYKQIFNSMLRDLDSASEVDLSNELTIASLLFLNQVGFITNERLFNIRNGITL